jgi:hypothetical protein
MISTKITSFKGTDIDFLHADAAQKAAFLKSILDDDVKSGFFMVFCESQFCTENIRFVVATIKYGRLFENDSCVWSPWDTDLGKNLNGDKRVHNEMSPEKCAEIERDMAYIHNRFLKPSGMYEICISQKILENTERRMREFRSYGPEVFKEARLDPINTLIKDILPRFVVSPYFEEMKFYIKALSNLPPASSLTVTPPNSAMSTMISVKNKTDVVDARLATLKTTADVEQYCRELNNYFVDVVLYTKLLDFLVRIVSSENLLCIRAINIFPQLFEETAESRAARGVATSKVKLNTKTKIKDGASEAVTSQAWLIYMYFLAPGSCYEVGISSAISRSVALNMAKPTKDMFESTKVAVMKVLQDHFITFLTSPEFAQLLGEATARMEARLAKGATDSKGVLPALNMKGWFSSS